MIRWSCSSKPAAKAILGSSSYWSDQTVSCSTITTTALFFNLWKIQLMFWSVQNRGTFILIYFFKLSNVPVLMSTPFLCLKVGRLKPNIFNFYILYFIIFYWSLHKRCLIETFSLFVMHITECRWWQRPVFLLLFKQRVLQTKNQTTYHCMSSVWMFDTVSADTSCFSSWFSQVWSIYIYVGTTNPLSTVHPALI